MFFDFRSIRILKLTLNELKLLVKSRCIKDYEKYSVNQKQKQAFLKRIQETLEKILINQDINFLNQK